MDSAVSQRVAIIGPEKSTQRAALIWELIANWSSETNLSWQSPPSAHIHPSLCINTLANTSTLAYTFTLHSQAFLLNRLFSKNACQESCFFLCLVSLLATETYTLSGWMIWGLVTYIILVDLLEHLWVMTAHCKHIHPWLFINYSNFCSS